MTTEQTPSTDKGHKIKWSTLTKARRLWVKLPISKAKNDVDSSSDRIITLII